MGIFDNLKVTTQSIGKAASKAATNTLNTIVAANKENSKKNAIMTELTAINGELNAAYMQIGEQFVEYVSENKEMPGIDVSDILKIMEPKLENKNELELELIQIEKKLKDQIILQEKAEIESECKSEKENLDKARSMNIITQKEYDMKLEASRKKIDNFELIRNLKKQHEMGIITEDELIFQIEDLS